MNEPLKRFNPIKINVMGFANRFNNRYVKYIERVNDDGSLNIEYGYINGAAICDKKLYLRILLEDTKDKYFHCLPEYLINSGNDFSH